MLGNQFKKPAKIREVVLAALVMLALCYLGYNHFFTPLSVRVKDLKTQIALIKSEADSVQKFNDVIRKNQKEQASPFQTTDSTLIKDPRVQVIQKQKQQRYRLITDFLQDVTTPQFRSALKIESLKYDKTQKLGRYSATNFEMVLNGRFARVLNYIKQLEEVEAVIALKDIEMTVYEKDINSVVLKIKGTFYQIDDDQV